MYGCEYAVRTGPSPSAKSFCPALVWLSVEADCRWSSCIFFFQAEDGIRDLTVTGVQTCALPISGDCLLSDPITGCSAMCWRSNLYMKRYYYLTLHTICLRSVQHFRDVTCSQIGRASCRERV